MTRNNCIGQKPCIHIFDYADFFEIPRDVVSGARMSGDCTSCKDISLWRASTRSRVQSYLETAVKTLEKDRQCALCPGERSIIVDPRDCPIQLEQPVDYLGKKVVLATYEYPICYTLKSACVDNFVGCKDLDRIGQVIVDQIPDGWNGDWNLVEFDYPYECSKTRQILPSPCCDYLCCQTTVADCPCPDVCNCYDRFDVTLCESVEPVASGYCLTLRLHYEGGQVFTVGSRIALWLEFQELPTLATVTAVAEDNSYVEVSFTDIDAVTCDQILQVSEFHFVVTWEKYELVDPRLDMARVTHEITSEESKLEGFIKTVTVTFYEIDETQAIEVLEVCHCDQCKTNKCCGFADCNSTTTNVCASETAIANYDYTLDKECGELCLYLDNTCGCIKNHKVKINYGVCPELDDDLKMIVILRALLWNPSIRCNCDDYDKLIEWWLDLEPGVLAEALANRSSYPFGKTRAGVTIARLLDADNNQKVADGRKESTGGMFSARKPKRERSRYFDPSQKTYNVRYTRKW